ncbi:MAG: hypothetical protein OXG65_11020 [Chloroflexi bacterium]|nr:hypothetical protein [Chloroflexota bacterium]
MSKKQLAAISDGLEEIDETLGRLCDILEEQLPSIEPDFEPFDEAPSEPGYICVDGGFVHLGEITVEEIGDAEVITDSEGNEWHRVTENCWSDA